MAPVNFAIERSRRVNIAIAGYDPALAVKSMQDKLLRRRQREKQLAEAQALDAKEKAAAATNPSSVEEVESLNTALQNLPAKSAFGESQNQETASNLMVVEI